MSQIYDVPATIAIDIDMIPLPDFDVNELTRKVVEQLDVPDAEAIDQQIEDWCHENCYLDSSTTEEIIMDYVENFIDKEMLREALMDYVCQDEVIDMTEDLQSMQEMIGSQAAHNLTLANQVEIARRSITMLLEERERSLSRRTANLFNTARNRTLFTLTLPSRLLVKARAALKAKL